MVFYKDTSSTKAWLILLHVLSELKLYPRSYMCWIVNKTIHKGSQNWKHCKPQGKCKEKTK